MPDRILIAGVAKLRLSGEGLFAELLEILEKNGVPGAARRGRRIVGVGEVDRRGMGAGAYAGERGSFLPCWARYSLR